MKLTFVQVEEARQRVMWGESARSVARLLGVTEGALRHHFRRGTHPRDLRKVAVDWDLAQLALAALSKGEQAAAMALVRSTRDRAGHQASTNPVVANPLDG